MNKKYKSIVAFTMSAAVFAGGVALRPGEAIVKTSKDGLAGITLAQEELIFDDPVALAAAAQKAGTVSSGSGAKTIKVAVAPGIVKYEKNNSIIDASNASDGYVMISNTASKKRLKIQIIKGGSAYNYDLKNGGKYEIYPLQLGNGNYKIRVMENTSGNKYIPLHEKTINVTLNNSLSPFLVPNQYVMYDQNWKIVAKANELTKGKTSEAEKVAAIYDYIIKNIKYDTHKANTVQSGYLPNIDETLATKKGICFDYAALLSGMLRSQGIPSRLIVGTVSPKDINHAWNEIYLKDKGWVTVKIEFEGSKWNRMDSTFASSGNSGIENFIGNGSNYTGLRLY